jgi:UDP-N-acetylglucosamine transferase subunit ALG13
MSFFTSADVVVTHGGPGTILEASSAGHRPVVVPRQRSYGEHVDDHQLRFAKRLAEDGMIVMALEQSQMIDAVERTIQFGRCAGVDDHSAEDAVAMLSKLVGELVANDAIRSHRASRLLPAQVRRMMERPPRT